MIIVDSTILALIEMIGAWELNEELRIGTISMHGKWGQHVLFNTHKQNVRNGILKKTEYPLKNSMYILTTDTNIKSRCKISMKSGSLRFS